MYVWQEWDTDRFAVGFYNPHGNFECQYLFDKRGNAEDKVHYLNGGNRDEQ